MKIIITGGAGFLGRKLAARLLERGTLAGPDGRQAAIDELLLFDVAAPQPPLPDDRRCRFVAGDIAAVAGVIDRATTTVFHLAAVVSGEAEADTDKGLRVNLDGTRAVLEACRALGTRPRLLFTSSIAAYGGALPPVIDDATALRPQTSYGTQKAIGELLVNDYSRKGFIDGRTLRLPTVVVRAGRPNRAASTWASSILREPLCGLDAVCPVSSETAMAVISPRRVIAALEQIHDLPGERLGSDRGLMLPAVTVTAAEMAAALREVGGTAAAARLRWQPDAAVQAIVDGWPRAVVAARARALGIQPDRDIAAILAAFIEEDLAAQKALMAGG